MVENGGGKFPISQLNTSRPEICIFLQVYEKHVDVAPSRVAMRVLLRGPLAVCLTLLMCQPACLHTMGPVDAVGTQEVSTEVSPRV